MTASYGIVLAACLTLASVRGPGQAERSRAPESEKYRPRPMEQRQLREPEQLFVETEGKLWKAFPAGDGSLEVLVPAGLLEQELEICVLEYPDSRVVLQQGDRLLELKRESREDTGENFGESLRGRGRKSEEEAYLPLGTVCREFGYIMDLPLGSLRIRLKDAGPEAGRKKLPTAYDYRQTGRHTRVRDQGNFGTCWSFASVTAMETALKPEICREFSADHMSLNNSFSLDQEEGGEYIMSMAYVLGWQGPVLEEEDPYGDGISPEGLKPAVHVQEIQILPPGDYRAIKRAVFFRGGVQSSLYTSITDYRSRSAYYDEETGAYCYEGEEPPNHDVVIVGWDDRYPKENFRTEVEGDGAFLCVSSWGEAFGDRGYFYVSYYDANIGSRNLVYTGIEAADNYDQIYQSDLCGWVGQVGYGSEKAFGANIYEAEDEELLRAVGFYAVGENTSYRIWLCRPADGEPDPEQKREVARGTMRYSGFYTVPLEVPVPLEPGERFAVILEAETPGAIHPLAVEFRADHAPEAADVTDGEGYVSADGINWESLEEHHQCNLCLKAYTDKREVRG